ncbi:MAG: hypothetical protein J0M33_19090 [Anaerolineae bacterium]|nr:hypothetical protein [Anaerolineae bacterium]
MDSIIRFIESLIQGLIGLLQPIFANGGAAYFVPLGLLALSTLFAFNPTLKGALAGYILGWVAAIGFIAMYLQGGGDGILNGIMGNTPRSELLPSALLGVFISAVVMLLTARNRLQQAAPIVLACVVAVSVILMFLSYRAGASLGGTTFQTAGMEELAQDRRRTLGAVALGFGAGVLVSLLLSAANPPPPPKPDAAKEKPADGSQ